MTIDPSYYAPGGFGDPQGIKDFQRELDALTKSSAGQAFYDAPLSQALGGGMNISGDIDPGGAIDFGGAGLAAINNIGGMGLGGSYGTGTMEGNWNPENTTSTTGYDITGMGTLTPMDLADEPYGDPYGDPTPYDPFPQVFPTNTPTTLPVPYNPTSLPPSTSTEITSESYTPLPQGSMNFPQFAFNFPMPNINPLMGGPNMGPVGFYSANSGAAGLPVPAYGGLENPNMLSNYVQQFVGGPDVLSRSLIG